MGIMLVCGIVQVDGFGSGDGQDLSQVPYHALIVWILGPSAGVGKLDLH